MKLRLFLAVVLMLAGCLAGFAAEPDRAPFRKLTLTDKFYCEGVTVADINKDGKPDLVAGPFWFEGPDFQKRHAFAEAKEVDPHGYSAFFLTFAWDIDGDGWVDILVCGFPGQEARWYKNPGKAEKDEPWKMYQALKPVDSESPLAADLFSDGKPKLICASQGRLGWAEPDADPTKPWKFTPADAAAPKRGLGHGSGYGDVNGDGKIDLLEADGWYEQPATNAATTAWKFHPAKFGSKPAQMLVYDVNGDGKPDVITSLDCHGYGVAWFEQTVKDGKEEWVEHRLVGQKPEDSPYGVKFTQHHALELADIDGDGVKDLITGKRFWAHGPNGDAEPAAPCVLYWFKLSRSNGKAEFVPHLIDDNSGVGTQIWVQDVTGDKKPEVLVGNKKGIYVFVNESK